MPLVPGARLGPHEIVSVLGTGGMGDVYRARDTRLGRDVALKVLGGRLRPGSEHRARFEREASAVAALNHPNIGTLYDVGRDGEIDYLVMELVQGETLHARLTKGPLPLAMVSRLGADIARALDAAHERGIVHRDLKPSNVMVTPTGAKLLDFGLARRFQHGLLDRPVLEPSGDLTVPGTILGTVPYMAPEQIEGLAVDGRTDIFALGVLLYEMLTGRRAFAATSEAALVAAILTTEPPPVASLRPSVPPVLDQLVRECMRKNPDERWRSARDAALILAGVAEEGAPGPPGTRRRLPALSWAALSVAGLAVLLWGREVTTRASRVPAPAPSVEFAISPPVDGGFAYTTETDFLAVSPDGQQVAYVAYGGGTGPQIWLRRLGSLGETPVRGTEGARGLAWSPDGRSLAFFVGGRLQRVELPDGAPVTICDIVSRNGQSLSWGAGGSILFAGVQGDGIYRVAAAGGAPAPVVLPDSAHGELRVEFPFYLPDGDHFLFLSRGQQDQSFVVRGGSSGARDTIMPAESLVQYGGSGMLAFVRDGSLLGQRFDEKSGRPLGSPFGIADSVRYFLSTGTAAFATSAGATMAYQRGTDLQRLAWFDRQGHEIGSVGTPAGFLSFAISGDGTQLLFDRQDPLTGTWDVRMLDLDRGVDSPLSTGRMTEAFGTWIPGTRAVLYSVARDGPPSLVRRDLDTGTETPLLPPGTFQNPTDVSSDSRTLLFSQRSGGGSFDIWTLPLVEGASPSPLVATPADEESARFSQDGRYVALLSDETGADEVYLTPFPGPGPRTRVSPDGAHLLRWSWTTNELIYVTPDQRVVRVPVRTQPLGIGPPTTLFTLPTGTTWTNFDISPDGKRILASISVKVADRQPVTVVSNWTASIRPR